MDDCERLGLEVLHPNSGRPSIDMSGFPSMALYEYCSDNFNALSAVLVQSRDVVHTSPITSIELGTFGAEPSRQNMPRP